MEGNVEEGDDGGNNDGRTSSDDNVGGSVEEGDGSGNNDAVEDVVFKDAVDELSSAHIGKIIESARTILKEET